jgi:hypothetical protein
MPSNRSSHYREGGQFGPTKFEFGKYSTFDDTPKNLMVTSDEDSGNLILWH